MNFIAKNETSLSLSLSFFLLARCLPHSLSQTKHARQRRLSALLFSSKRLQVAPERAPPAPSLPRSQPQRHLADSGDGCCCRFASCSSSSSAPCSSSAPSGPQDDDVDAPARGQRRRDLSGQPRQRSRRGRRRGSSSSRRRRRGRRRGGDGDGAEGDDAVPPHHPGLLRGRGGRDVVDSRKGDEAVERSGGGGGGGGGGAGLHRSSSRSSSGVSRRLRRRRSLLGAAFLQQPPHRLLDPAREGLVVVHASDHQVAVPSDRGEVEVGEREALEFFVCFCFFGRRGGVEVEFSFAAVVRRRRSSPIDRSRRFQTSNAISTSFFFHLRVDERLVHPDACSSQPRRGGFNLELDLVALAREPRELVAEGLVVGHSIFAFFSSSSPGNKTKKMKNKKKGLTLSVYLTKSGVQLSRIGVLFSVSFSIITAAAADTMEEEGEARRR